MKLLVLTVCVEIFVAPSARAQTFQIRGQAGYLSEYELTADVSGQAAEQGQEEFSGPLTVKHVGLCTHAGPDEMLGRLKIRFASARKVEASLSYDGHECTYSGPLSESVTGVMTCNNNKLILPLKLWTD